MHNVILVLFRSLAYGLQVHIKKTIIISWRIFQRYLVFSDCSSIVACTLQLLDQSLDEHVRHLWHH